MENNKISITSNHGVSNLHILGIFNECDQFFSDFLEGFFFSLKEHLFFIN